MLLVMVRGISGLLGIEVVELMLRHMGGWGMMADMVILLPLLLVHL
jgi:hypothetical protein